MKRILYVFLLSVLFMVGCTTDKTKEEVEGTPVGRPYIHPMVEKKTLKDVGDGWTYFISIQYEKVDMNSADIKNNYKDEVFYTYFNGINLKYRDIEGSYVAVIDNKTGEEIGQGPTDTPTLATLNTVKGEVSTINKFLRDKKFKSTISINDLDGLECPSFDKQLLVDLYNDALRIEPESFGMFGVLPGANSVIVKDSQERTWQGGYFLNYGQIGIIDFECIVNGENISDLVNDQKADDTQMKIQENLDQMEKYILSNQVFSIDDITWVHPDVMDEEILKSLNAVLKMLYTGDNS